MKTIWELIKQQKWEGKTKQYVFILSITLFWCLIGTVIWLLVGNRLCSENLYMIAFIGYPGFILGLIGSIIYLYNHER